ncbi:MAG: formyl-coenzyme A transferase [Candidatus Bathyarchaeota archaeon BA1]|nr:MAG: formyl-coenzyme A transferase [Candidatus Bathyarchaeota archaeon BA1]
MEFVRHQYTSNEEKLREMLETIRNIFKTKILDEWLRVLSKEDVPCGPIYKLDEVFSDPQILHRRMIVEAEYPAAGKIKQISTPIKFSETPCKIWSPPPLFGEHTEQILRWLGYAEEEILDMRGKAII